MTGVRLQHNFGGRRFWFGIIAGGSFALTGLSGCDQPSANPDKQVKAAAPPPVVSATQPRVQSLIDWDEYTGRFDAVEAVDVRARISGYLDRVMFKDGQEIKKGDLLFVIDARSFERALEQAKAELGQATTKVQNASLDVDRGRPLMERRVMSEKTYDDRASLLRDAQASVKVAEAKVASVELDLAFTRIQSPIDGRISRAMVTAGNWVSAGANANSTVLTTIVRQNPLYVYFDVSEGNYLKYKRLMARGEQTGAGQSGASVEIATSDESSYNTRGKLDFIENRLDAGTATMRTRALVDNDADLFSPGMFARIRIAGSARYNAVLIPDEAIASDQASKYVLIVGEGDVVVRRALTLGPLHAGLRVVRDGVQPGEWVITKGARARPGQKVEVRREAIRAGSEAASSPQGTLPETRRN